MADRNLTFEEFQRLPTERERSERYGDLSDSDKFRVRITMPPGPPVYIPCNECTHRLEGKAACKAFPEGFHAEHIRALVENRTEECGNGFRFEKK